VRFVVIGGLAMVLHGSDHVTGDIDVSIARDVVNFGAIVQALDPFHPRLRGAPLGIPFFWDVRTLQTCINLTLTTDLGKLDLLGEPVGAPPFEVLWQHAEIGDIGGVSVRFACLEDLIAMKRAANRPQDQRHVAELQALRRLLHEDETPE